MHQVGLDIIEISRIEQAIARWGDRFLRRVYTEAELKLCRGKAASLAARFAAKEAVMKALGTGAKGVGWREIEIGAHPSGQPTIRLWGRALDRARRLGLGALAISLTHSREYALASVIAIEDEDGPFLNPGYQEAKGGADGTDPE